MKSKKLRFAIHDDLFNFAESAFTFDYSTAKDIQEGRMRT